MKKVKHCEADSTNPWATCPVNERLKPNELITASAKTLFSYCRTRTNSREEAEDLSQDIILELLKSKGSFNNEKAFYGFMWVVAGNVYKNWCKKRAKANLTELGEHTADENIPFTELLGKEADLQLLYRELGLLTEQYRKVVILYYFDELKVAAISKSLGINRKKFTISIRTVTKFMTQ